MKKLKIIFIGGGVRAVPLYDYVLGREDVSIELAIHAMGYDDEKEYGQELVRNSEKWKIPYVVSDIITEDILSTVKAIAPDVILGGGTWRSLLKRPFLEAARFGYISMHGSGLPAYRGWCPINWYIINGERELVSRMFQLDEGIDSGAIVADREGKFFECRINLRNKYYGEVLQELAKRRIAVYERLLDCLIRNEITLVPQDDRLATYGCNRGPADGAIDWSEPTERIYNFIRGQSHPAPGAYSFYKNKKFHIWRASVPGEKGKYVGRIPGKVVERLPSGEVDVLTGDGLLRIENISVDGRPVPPGEFILSIREKLGFEVQVALAELFGRLEALEDELARSK